jgi:hypothetical protein
LNRFDTSSMKTFYFSSKILKDILYDIVKKLQNESQNDNFSNRGRLLLKGI